MDIFDFALKMESDGEKYYRQQAKATHFEDLKVLLEALADEEARHYKIVEAMRAQNNEYLQGDDSLAKACSIFVSYKKDANALKKAISIEKLREEQIDVYRVALAKEKESIELYEKMLGQAKSSAEKAVLEKLVKEEGNHALALDNVIELLNRVNDWVEAAEFNHREPY